MARTEIKGLDAFRRELRVMGKEFGKGLGQANKEAAKVVADAGARMARAKGGVAAKAAPGIVASAAQRVAKVAIGGARFPFGIGAETGSKRFAQFDPYVGLDTEGKGYALGPAIVSEEERFIDVYGDAMERLAARAFPSY